MLNNACRCRAWCKQCALRCSQELSASTHQCRHCHGSRSKHSCGANEQCQLCQPETKSSRSKQAFHKTCPKIWHRKHETAVRSQLQAALLLNFAVDGEPMRLHRRTPLFPQLQHTQRTLEVQAGCACNQMICCMHQAYGTPRSFNDNRLIIHAAAAAAVDP